MKKDPKPPAAKPRRMGRPSRKQSQEIDARIKSAALDMFIEHGYEAATMDAIAAAADITKRSLYTRYNTKEELFLSALRQSREEWHFQGMDTEEFAEKPLREQLQTLGEMLLEQVLNPRIIKISRMAMSQANNFPRELRENYDISLSPRITSIKSSLKAHESRLKPKVRDNPDMAAELFISLITGIPARLAGMGTLRDPDYEQTRVQFAVELFLDAISNSAPTEKNAR